MISRPVAPILGLLAAAALAAGARPGQAQQVGHRPLVLTVPASTQAMALGDAFQLTERISDVLFYNPALLDRARGIEGAAQRWGTRSTSFTLSGAAGWLGGGVGIGVQSLSYTVPATEGLGTEQDLLTTAGTVPVSELVATGGISRRLGVLRVGLAMKLVDQRIGPVRDGTAGLDLGVAWVGDKLTLGFAAQNLGPDLTISGADYGLPRRLTLAGATQNLPLGPLDLSGVVALTFDQDDEWIPAVGAQAEWWPVVGRTFIARLGWRRVPSGEAWPFTAGVGFTGDQLGLSYAYQRFDGDLRGAHRLSVRWR